MGLLVMASGCLGSDDYFSICFELCADWSRRGDGAVTVRLLVIRSVSHDSLSQPAPIETRDDALGHSASA